MEEQKTNLVPCSNSKKRMDLQQQNFMDFFNHEISCSHKRRHKEFHYIVCTSLTFPFSKQAQKEQRTQNCSMTLCQRKYCTQGSILPSQRDFFFQLSECFLACRQCMSRENSVCSFKNSPKHFSLCENFLKLKQEINSKSNSLLSHPCYLFLIPLRTVYHSSTETKISSI